MREGGDDVSDPIASAASAAASAITPSGALAAAGGLLMAMFGLQLSHVGLALLAGLVGMTLARPMGPLRAVSLYVGSAASSAALGKLAGGLVLSMLPSAAAASVAPESVVGACIVGIGIFFHRGLSWAVRRFDPAADALLRERLPGLDLGGADRGGR